MRKVDKARANGYRLGQASKPLSRLRRLEAEPAFATGLAWYVDARNAIKRLARVYHRRLTPVAAVVAVLSPRQSVNGNITLAVRALAGEAIGGFSVNAAKARAILASPSMAEQFTKGPKVQAFYQALLGYDALVLDSWAIRAVIGKDDARGKARERIERAYKARAKALGLGLASYQAGIWAAMREASGFKNGALMSAAVNRALGE
jgi:hypothetical protein